MSRDVILGRVRSAIGADPENLERRGAVATRLAEPPHHLVPAIACAPSAELLARFEAALRSRAADLIAVAAAHEIPGAIAHFLRAHGLDLHVRAGSDPYLTALPWPTAPDLTIETGPAQAGDSAGLSRALAGVAETGTLVLASGDDNPVTLAYLPGTHLVVLEASAIVGSYETAMQRVAARYGAGTLPRTLNLISGASRTADIGGKVVMGAHGPRRLAVLVVGAPSS
jgi:L-lactate dehydrogenase complex protein LldG